MTEADPTSGMASHSEPLSVPELAGMRLPPVHAAGAEEGSRKSRPALQESQVQSSAWNFSAFVHGYLWSTVTFAEQKAAFVFTVETAFLAYVVSQGALRGMRVRPLNWTANEWLAISSVAFLLVSLITTVSVVMPRLAGARTGLIYFNAIAARQTANQYISEVFECKDLSRATLEHCHELSGICRRKYAGVQWAILIGLLGFVTGFVWIIRKT